MKFKFESYSPFFSKVVLFRLMTVARSQYFNSFSPGLQRNNNIDVMAEYFNSRTHVNHNCRYLGSIKTCLPCRETGDELTKTTVRRGLEFDVTVHRLLPPTEIQAETVFSCSMEIPGTQFSLRKRPRFL